MKPIANRITKLGTETVFAVAAAAAARAAQGKPMYPFHVGDINLGAPPNVIEAMAKALADGKGGYVGPGGIAPLREALADDVGAARGLKYGPENVAVMPGGKPVIGKFIQTLMNPGDEVLYPSPGFPIYESMIEYFGGIAMPYGYQVRDGRFALDMDQLRSRITPRTRCLIFNNCHNPTAAESDPAELAQLAELVLKHDLWVMSDDAYSEVRYAGQTHHLTSLPGMQARTVILYTFGKKFGMTGWRLGAAIGPQAVIDVMTQLNLNDESCTSQPTQWAGVAALRGPSGAHTKFILETFRERRDAALSALAQIPGVSVCKPDCAFYLFPDVTEAARRKGFTNTQDFATACMDEIGVSFAARDHFNRVQPGEQRMFIRLAYGGINTPQIVEALRVLRDWLE